MAAAEVLILCALTALLVPGVRLIGEAAGTVLRWAIIITVAALLAAGGLLLTSDSAAGAAARDVVVNGTAAAAARVGAHQVRAAWTAHAPLLLSGQNVSSKTH